MTEPAAPADPPATPPMSQRVVEVRALAEILYFLPAPAKMMIADKMHGLGARVHPELATLELHREGPAELGNHAPQTPVRKAALRDGMAALAQVNPALAARIAAAHDDPERMAQLRAAETNAQKIALAKELGVPTPDEIPEDLKAQLPPEMFETPAAQQD